MTSTTLFLHLFSLWQMSSAFLSFSATQKWFRYVSSRISFQFADPTLRLGFVFSCFSGKAGKKFRGSIPAWDISNKNELDKWQLLLIHWLGPRAENPSQDLCLAWCSPSDVSAEKKKGAFRIWRHEIGFNASQLQPADALTYQPYVITVSFVSVSFSSFIALELFFFPLLLWTDWQSTPAETLGIQVSKSPVSQW